MCAGATEKSLHPSGELLYFSMYMCIARAIYTHHSKSRVKEYWEGGAWVEPDTTSKLFDPVLFPHQRKISTEGIMGQYPSSMLGRTLHSVLIEGDVLSARDVPCFRLFALDYRLLIEY